MYYASSLVTAPIQIADLIAGTRRRLAEGDASLADLERHMEQTLSVPNGRAPTTISGRSYRTKIQLF